MKKNKGYTYQQSGFTLIELLVVVAVIGVLSAIVVVFLGDARARSKDTSVKASLNQVRTQADIYYTAKGNYSSVCRTSSNNLDPKGINAMVYNAGKINGYIDVVLVNSGIEGTYSPVRCNQGTNSWAAEVPLKGETGYYCVDYTGKGIVTTNVIEDISGSPTYNCI